MLSVENVTKKYGSFTALEDVSLAFEKGVYGLLAPNGAGKTTFIKMLATLLFPTDGVIRWEGRDILSMGGDWRGMVGYLPQQFGYYKSYSPGRSWPTWRRCSAWTKGAPGHGSTSFWTWWGLPT